MKKKRILFVCVHNSARSQMAEGILRSLYGENYEGYSAGTAPTSVNPLAVEAMAEIGIDISHQYAKGLGELKDMQFDLAVTVCGPASSCPFVPGVRAVVHREFHDPAASSDISTFRKVRDEIFNWIQDAFRDPDNLPSMPQTPMGQL
jgi:arsenate reductase